MNVDPGGARLHLQSENSANQEFLHGRQDLLAPEPEERDRLGRRQERVVQGSTGLDRDGCDGNTVDVGDEPVAISQALLAQHREPLEFGAACAEPQLDRGPHGLGRPEGEALAVREAIRELLLEHNGCQCNTTAASVTLEEAGRKARLAVRFVGGRPVLAPECEDTRGAVAAVAELTTTPEWVRLKACRDESCRVAFYDKSRNRSRAWCSMEVCGNREKARAFRAKHG